MGSYSSHLTEKRPHRTGSTHLETLDQRYNIRGWLTRINDVENLGTRRFGLRLTYEQGAYGWNANTQFNGNIATMTWRHGGQAEHHTYALEYDRLNRLRNAYYADRRPDYSHNSPGRFDELLAYDRNGNITQLVRKEGGVDADALLYAYDGNRLRKVNDQVTAVTPNHFPKNDQHHSLTAHYTYDGNGNAVSDVNKAITSVTYSHLNKPIRINLSSGGWIEYRYDAMGSKLSKTTSTGVTTDYVGGIEYDGLVLKRLPMGEGYIEALPNSTYEYSYALKDHLGNTRVVLAQTGTVLQRNHYYPFGLSIASLDFSGPGAAWKYQYNGKEKQTDFGLNWLDYGARMYDPVVGRWHSIDAKATKYSAFTPYAYAGNAVTNAIDPDGERIIFVNGYWNNGNLNKILGRPIGTAGGRDYWNYNIENSARKYYGETDQNSSNPIYVDGNIGFPSSSSELVDAGKKYAEQHFDELTKDLKDGETLKFYSHSMGGPFAAGMIEYLEQRGHKVESHISVSPYNWQSFSHAQGPTTHQVDVAGDPVVEPKIPDGVDHGTAILNGFNGPPHALGKDGDIFDMLPNYNSMLFGYMVYSGNALRISWIVDEALSKRSYRVEDLPDRVRVTFID